jgi:energy-coupling factor transporter ATP-binding protein EcfA2
MQLHPEETEAGPWRRVDDAELAALVAPLLTDGRGVLLVDGRSGSGKSTIATRLADLLRGAIVHSDDLAWHHDAFAWDDLARDHVIAPWRRGESVEYRPPGWVAKGREGAVTVPADVRVLVLEGVGAGRAALATQADAVVWVQSDRAEARERGLRRDVELGRTPKEAESFWDEWMAAEEPFLAADRPWERADLVVRSSPDAWAPGLTTVAPGRGMH